MDRKRQMDWWKGEKTAKEKNSRIAGLHELQAKKKKERKKERKKKKEERRKKEKKEMT